MYVYVITHRTSCTLIHTYLHADTQIHTHISTSRIVGCVEAAGGVGRLLALALLAHALRPGKPWARGPRCGP